MIRKMLLTTLALALLTVPCAQAAQTSPMLVTSQTAPVSQRTIAGEALGFAMLKQLYAQDGDALISPYSLAEALSMAAAGANGETLAEMLQLLDVPAPSTIALDDPSVVTANALFAAERDALLDSYLAALEGYGANCFDLKESALEDINAWAKEQTGGLIDPLLSQPLDPKTKLVLLNAISLKADWQSPFNPANTQDGVFHAPDGEITTSFMHQDEFVDCVLGDTNLLRLPYANGHLAAYFILPPEGGMDAALSSLAQEGYAFFDGMTEQNLALALPKLNLAKESDMTATLAALGLKTATSMDADFSNMNGARDLFIGQVFQKACLAMDEQGTTAAAVTEVAMMVKAVMAPPIPLTFDRPFILLVRDEESGQTLFAACVSHPGK
ncbi:MAG: serpin family protein [Clostridia bacterium]